MSLIGDRYIDTYEGHTIELVRNNWNKTLKLLIDGREVARAVSQKLAAGKVSRTTLSSLPSDVYSCSV